MKLLEITILDSDFFFIVKFKMTHLGLLIKVYKLYEKFSRNKKKGAIVLK